MHGTANPPARILSGEFLTLTLGWVVIGFNSVVLGMTLLAGLAVVYGSFRTPMLGYFFVVYVTVIAPILLAITAIRFFRSGLQHGGPAAWLGLFTATPILGAWIWLVAIA